MLKVISLWAGPGAGKSTAAAATFARMKRLRFHVELVTEYAKDLTYQKDFCTLRNQWKVLSEQNFRIARLEGQTEYVITDSPLPLSLIYCSAIDYEVLRPVVRHMWSQYDNIALALRRTAAPFVGFGRNETEEQARELDTRIYTEAQAWGATKYVDADSPNIEDLIIREVNARKIPCQTQTADAQRCPA